MSAHKIFKIVRKCPESVDCDRVEFSDLINFDVGHLSEGHLSRQTHDNNNNNSNNTTTNNNNNGRNGSYFT